MDTYQAFLLGLMVAYTPSLIFFAWMLWRVSSENKQRSAEVVGQSSDILPEGARVSFDVETSQLTGKPMAVNVRRVI